MRTLWIKTGLALLITILFILALAVPIGPLPTLGPLFSPVGGIWSAANDGYFASQESYTLAGLSGPVTIQRDRYGVPHIFAGTDADAAFALGWLHARERLAQMDIQRRNAAGTLAALVGKDALENDKFMRDIGLRRAAEMSMESMDPREPAMRAMQGYADGVNAYISSISPNHLPLEYKLLGVKQVEPYTVLDELIFAKYMAWYLNSSFDDLYLTELTQKMGAQKVAELFPFDRPYESPITPAWPANDQVNGNPTALHQAAVDILSKAAAAGQLRHAGDWRGSNNWAVNRGLSATGSPLFASDPHLGYQLPSLWYIAHIVTPSQDVMGVTLAGMPVVVIGHTRNIAWGLTNTQADVIDFFTEKINPNNPKQYWHNGAWQNVKKVNEDIQVRGAPVEHYSVRYTVHGPILTQIGFTVAMQWTGSGPTFEARALFNLNHAEDYAAFKSALSEFAVPAQNFAYADTAGNIAIWSAGKFPIRKSGDGRTVADGSTGDQDWIGSIPFEQVPHVLNPGSGYVFSANQRPAPANYPYLLGWQWDPSYRARRIEQALKGSQSFTLQDMGALQYDSKDTLAETLLPVMLPVVAASETGDSEAQSALQQLSQWDYRTTVESLVPVLWTRWLEIFRRMTWADDWKAAGFQFNDDGSSLKDWGAWGFNGDNEYQPPLELWEQMVREQPNSPYFDDLSTEGVVETRDDLIKASFAEMVTGVVHDYGGDPNGWGWGDHHKLLLKHLLDIGVLNRSGASLPGDGNSPNGQSNTEYSDGGPSWRMLVDLGSVQSAVGVYPGGQSGAPLSQHYDDLLPLWVKGGYIPLLFPASPQALTTADLESSITLSGK